MKLSQELKWRGFWNQTTFTDANLIDEKNFTLYLGTDPSADSLHVGHLAVYMMVRRFLEHGHKVILLVGGGTGVIGDMRDTQERELTPLKEIDHNKTALSAQVSKLFSGKEFTLVDNYDWLKDVQLLPFLRDIGKKFNMADLTSREFFKTRIENGGGLSYAEFSYTLLQGYDFWHLHKNYGANLQIGGSDQWGNLLSGVELIRKKESQEVFAMTSPLVINKSTGRKFGKSEGGAVWLDSQKTSPYKFYQFWLNSDDTSAIDYLKLFTLLNKNEIDAIEQQHQAAPQKRLAQKILASEITTLVHSEETAISVAKTTEVLFGGSDLSTLNEFEINLLSQEIATINLDEGFLLSEALAEAEIAKSKGDAKRLIKGGALSMAGNKIADDFKIVSPSLFKKGKNTFLLIK
ncbi:tyrosine--tRNA ligase [Candidatus Saccharibacteria bacterium]|nr:tyrosine--tRNA ligase [Candidatus Saccharibacteria bacterium]